MKIYIIIPYSHPNPAIRDLRFKIANQVAADLMAQGHIVYSPISHSHPIAVQCDLPLDYDHWEEADKAFIDWCDAVYVVRIPGWKKSTGVTKEIEYARSQGKGVIYSSDIDDTLLMPAKKEG